MVAHLPNCGCEIVDLVAAIQCASSTNDVGGTLASGDNTLEHPEGRDLPRGNGEENFVLRIIKLSQRKKISFQVVFYSFYRADQGHARRVKAGPGARTAPSHFQPFQSLPEAEEALQDLLNNEEDRKA